MPRRHTVLVVDDEPDVVKSVQDLLRLDYRVLGATRASEALELLETEPVHVVMSDQRMPEMTGVEFLGRVRHDHPEAIRLLFTGYADIRSVIDAINKGSVYRYIVKPWDPDELQTIIREACDRHDLVVERARLFAELERKHQELEVANHELLRANELKTGFIKVASHELRGPLTILLALAQMASATPEMPSRLRDWIGRIEQAGWRLNRIVEQLTTMLAIGHFERALARTPVDASDLLQTCADDVAPFLAMRNQTLALDAPSSLGTILVEETKIRDALVQILMNAVKFTPDRGGIFLSARKTEPDGLEIRVRDTGVGIPAVDLDQLFKPFFTSADTSHHSSGNFEFGKRGMGLGLSVAKAFVGMHGGDVRALSEPGAGTTFVVTLPGSRVGGAGA